MRARLTGEIDRDLEGRTARFEQYCQAESAEDPGPQLRDELEEFCQALPPGSFISISGANGFRFSYPASQPRAGLRTTRREFRWNGEMFVLEAGAPMGEAQHTLELLRL